MIKLRRAALVLQLSFLTMLSISKVVAPLSNAATFSLISEGSSAVEYWLIFEIATGSGSLSMW